MTDVLTELEKWAVLKVGDPMPNEWGPPLTAVLNAAITEIKMLRARPMGVTRCLDCSAILPERCESCTKLWAS